MRKHIILGESIISLFILVSLSFQPIFGNESEIKWWKNKRTIKRIVIYGAGIPSYNRIVENAGIETIDFKEILEDIIKYLSKKKGVKKENPIMRLITYLNNEKIIKV